MSFSPVVAVSAPVRRDPDTAPYTRLRTTYIAALENARIVPVITSPAHNSSYADSLVARVDGIVLTGGEDVNPALYGAAPHPKLGALSEERDTWEIALVKCALERRVPVLAICRGVQILNVALGGTLVQDLPSVHASEINHDPDLARSERSHSVEIASDSRVARAVGVTQLAVNSVHHQAVERVADSLRVVANATDGTIEAVESAPESGWWCVGVQWHPEDLVDSPQPWDRSLFAAFADAVRRGREQPPFRQ